jgi:hypothetical protein
LIRTLVAVLLRALGYTTFDYTADEVLPKAIPAEKPTGPSRNHLDADVAAMYS